MATPAFGLNPMTLTNAVGSFSVTLDGFIQGFAQDDPNIRNQLTGGILDAAETIPMVGGVPINETFLNPANFSQTLGSDVTRATSQATCSGFSVFNQNYAGINTPQSPVPTIGNGMLVNLFRLGSNARICCAMDPAITSLAGTQYSPPTNALYWDVTNYRVTTTSTGGNWALPTTIKIVSYNIGNSMVTSYASGTGFTTWVRTGSACILQI